MELLRERQESRLRRGHRSPLAAGAKDGEGERPVDVVPRRDAAESEGKGRLQTARWRRRIGENTVQPDRRGHIRLVGFRLAVEAYGLRLRPEHRVAVIVVPGSPVVLPATGR